MFFETPEAFFSCDKIVPKFIDVGAAREPTRHADNGDVISTHDRDPTSSLGQLRVWHAWDAEQPCPAAPKHRRSKLR
jgi:hypothetical protein